MDKRNEQSRRSAPRGLLASRFLKRDVGATLVAVIDILVVIGLMIAVNVAVSRPGCSWNHRGDWTAFDEEKRVFSLSGKTRKFLAEINQPVHVLVLYAPPQGQRDYSLLQNVTELLKRMERQSRYLHVEQVNTIAEPGRAGKLLQKHNVKADQDAFYNPTTGQAGGGQIVFISDKRKKSVSFNDIASYTLKKSKQKSAPGAKKPEARDYRLQYFSGEEVFLNALITVTQQQQPRLCFTTGNGEASIGGHTPFDLAFAAEKLKQQNFETETVEKISGHVPVRCDVLVVAGPRVALPESAISAIGAYLAKGGKLMYMARTLDVAGQAWSKSGLEELLARYGIHVEDALAIDAKQAERALPPVDRTMVPLAWRVKDGWNSKHPIGRALAAKWMRIDSPRALRAEPKPHLDVRAVLSTEKGPESWGERDLYSVARFDPTRDIKGPVPVVVAAAEKKQPGKRKKRARVMVLGSYLIVANYKLTPNQPSFDFTKEFVLTSMNWLTEQESLVALPPRRPEHVKLKLTIKQVNRVARLVVLWLPLLAVGLGLLVWILPSAGTRRSRARRKKPPADDDPTEGGAR